MSQALLQTINRKKDLRLFFVISVIIITVFLSLYIFQVSLMVRGTSLIESYEKQINELGIQNKKLEITFSQKNSLKITENLLKDLSFEKVAKIEYIRVLETSVAAK